MPKAIQLLVTRVIGSLVVLATTVSFVIADNTHSGLADAVAKHFAPGGLVTPAKIVDCRLSGGTQTKCISLTVGLEPSGFTMCPWCPRSITDGPDKSGIWLHEGTVHDADGAFIKNASTFFKDKTWQLFDPKTGRVRVTDNETACRAAARPDVDPKYKNYCVECETSYVKSGTTHTFVIPLTPVLATQPSNRIGRSGAGLSFNGIRLDAPAPVHAILGAHTLAPFDDCGGHVNPHAGYHIHAVTDCLKSITLNSDHTPAIGLSLDGHFIHKGAAQNANPQHKETALSDLDQCGGHIEPSLGYHYHAGNPGSNAVLGCHVGERGCVLDSPDDYCDAMTWQAWFRSWFK